MMIVSQGLVGCARLLSLPENHARRAPRLRSGFQKNTLPLLVMKKLLPVFIVIALVGLAAAEGTRQHASPYARRLAQEKGVDLSNVKGSGPGGRIMAADIVTPASRRQRSETNNDSRGQDAPEPAASMPALHESDTQSRAT